MVKILPPVLIISRRSGIICSEENDARRMISMKLRHIIMGTAAVTLLSAVLSSCGGGFYKNSDKYISGNFTYDSANIKKVEVNWVYGNLRRGRIECL